MMREPSPPPHGIRRSYWITVAKPGCVICTVTGRVEASVAGMSAFVRITDSWQTSGQVRFV